MTQDCCPKCGQAGPTIGSIVARETTHGTFEGGTSGLGFGTGGLGLFAGTVSGTTHSATDRARAMRAPQKASFNWSSVIGPIAIAVFALVAYQVVPGLLSSLTPPSGAPAAPDAGTIQQAMGNLMDVVAPVGVIGAAVMVIFMIASSKGRYRQAESTYQADTLRWEGKKRVYDRLRYCEMDHQVFDPLTGRTCTASQNDILAMIDSLASGGWKTAQGVLPSTPDSAT